MDPATPEKQKSPGHSAPVEATPEPDTQSRPAANISASSPTTPEKQKTHGVSAPGDTALEPQSVLNVTVTGPTTPREQKSPDSPPLWDIDLVSLTLSVSEFTKDLLIEMTVLKLSTILRELIVRCALVMGCTRSYHTYFTPPTAEIRQELSPFSDLDAKYIVDMVVSIMLEEWAKQCRYVIVRYRDEMRRDLLKEAKEESEALKPKVIEVVEAKVRALERHRSEDYPRPTTPTPTARAPPTTPTADDINTAIESLEIRTPVRIRKLGEPGSSNLYKRSQPESPASIRSRRTPRATTKRTAPSRFSTPQSLRSRNSTPMTPRPGTPAESPLKARAPPGHEHTGMLGPHPVFSPVRRSEPELQYKFNPED
ncbi:hypothetical protein F5B21DRAFT_508928 [Xylaria acuta]|nr:hypothetical protein F5B21DRAFT_508928 [Xylaria acuta]